MPWNEPGSSGDKNKDKDPWGRRDDKQGPPDLDDLFKDLKNKFNQSFGGGNGGAPKPAGPGGTSGSGLPSKSVLTTIVVVAAGLWLATGFYKVTEGNQGVQFLFGKYTQTTDAGLHWRLPSPLTQVEIVNVSAENSVEVGYRSRGASNTSVPQEALMLTKDENIIDMEFAVQYNISSPTELLFNVSESMDSVVRQATESAVREVIGNNTMEFAIISGRASIASEVKTLLQEMLNRYQAGINIRSVEMQGAKPPIQVKDAFDDAIRAREDRERLINLAQAYASDILPRARGRSARILEEAEGYKASIVSKAKGEASRFDQVRTEYSKAPEVTRSRMYIDTMENVLGSTSKMVLDQGGNNNSVMYLPLDKLLENGAASQNAPKNPSTNSYSPNAVTAPSTPAQPAQSRGSRTVNRSVSR